ncbi:hypothetical protein BDW66DRAFT_130264 [Aspergillus desertorum]
MPTPIAKGIIIGVAALVAAGIAVYESPQFRRWVNDSRRKLAMTLHGLGDDFRPGNGDSRYRHDISMTEEIGPAAAERRRIAREEISRRRSVLEERRKESNSSLGTFDTLVDENGRLLDLDDQVNSVANSTGLDLGAPQPTHRGRQSDSPAAQSTVLFEADTAPEPGKLQLSIPAPRSRASSAAAADFTPVSEVSEVMASAVIRHSANTDRPGSSASSHTEGGFTEVIYTHPDSIASEPAEDRRSPFSDLEGLHFARSRPATPATPSTADDFSHIAVDASSDGVLSEFEGSIGRVMTPASWSEVGSDVSNDEYRHRRF